MTKALAHRRRRVPWACGLAVIDNIDVNSHIITSGFGPGAGSGEDNSSGNKNGEDKGGE